MKIEVEVRSFISKNKYFELLEFFKKNAKLIKKDFQETYYFDSLQDFRIQKNNFYSKIWLKKGKMHDEKREELEIKFKKDDFEDLKKLFVQLGYKIKIKWFRKRVEFDYKGFKVCVDNTKGYGFIIEIEKLCDSYEKEIVLKKSKLLFNELKIPISKKEEFEKKFKEYEKNWRNWV